MTKKQNPIGKFLAAAESGDAEAQYKLATRYRRGDGVAENLVESLNWYRKAAEAGHSNAMTDLGSMLLRGFGCRADPVKAVKWFKFAAKTGNRSGCYNLAKRYLHGTGVNTDYKKALHWFFEAAKQDDTQATCELGTMFRFGEGVSRNLIIAAELHLIAAKQGDHVAIRNLSNYLGKLQGIALSGNPTASRCLSEIYSFGLGAETSMPLTWAWITWAKEHCPPSDDLDDARVIDKAYAVCKRGSSPSDLKQGAPNLALLIAAGRMAGKKRVPRTEKNLGGVLGVNASSPFMDRLKALIKSKRTCKPSLAIRRAAASIKGKYVPDPDLQVDGMDMGLYDNDPGFDEAPTVPGSEEEFSEFDSLAENKIKPKDVRADVGFRARYALYLKVMNEKKTKPALHLLKGGEPLSRL